METGLRSSCCRIVVSRFGHKREVLFLLPQLILHVACWLLLYRFCSNDDGGDEEEEEVKKRVLDLFL